MGFVTLPCAAITCAWPPRAGRLGRTGNPSLLEAMAYTLLAMSELGQSRRLGNVRRWSAHQPIATITGVCPNFALVRFASSLEIKKPRDGPARPQAE
jgi:hypothetical protein